MPPCVLVIEDDADVRSSVCALVEALGYQARAFADAQSFLAERICASAGHDQLCIVTDLNLPGMSGIEMAESLHAQNVRTPVIIVSADGRNVAARAARAGVVAVLRKPLAADALSQWLDQIFTR